MTTIFTCGSLSDRSIRCVLPDVLARYGGVQYFNGSELFRTGQNPPRFLLYEWQSLPRETGTRGILLFKNSFSPVPGLSLPGGLLPVFEARNPVVSRFLQGSAAVTCGTSVRDTLSVASLRDHSALVSLQRSICTLDGTLIEPAELSVSLSEPRSPHQLLAAVSVLLLSGVPWENGYSF